MITGYARPLKIVGVPSIPIADEEMLSFDDDPLCPNEFKCPITTQIMTTPVVMADGVSYEYTQGDQQVDCQEGGLAGYGAASCNHSHVSQFCTEGAHTRFHGCE